MDERKVDVAVLDEVDPRICEAWISEANGSDAKSPVWFALMLPVYLASSALMVWGGYLLWEWVLS